MANSDSAIGVFDSGIGGLTVLHQIIEALPNENTVYLGDTARSPYGTKSNETVLRYSFENSQFLVGVSRQRGGNDGDVIGGNVNSQWTAIAIKDNSPLCWNRHFTQTVIIRSGLVLRPSQNL